MKTTGGGAKLESAKGGFSLVEVVMALGIASFTLVTMVGLLGVGLTSSKESLQETEAINLVQSIIADRQGTPMKISSKRFSLPVLTTSGTVLSDYFGVSDAGVTTGRVLTQARYRVDYNLKLPTSSQLDPYVGYFRVSWPAQANQPQGSIEVVAAFAQP